MSGIVSVEEILTTYPVTRGKLYVLAHRRKWHRIKWDGRVYYRLAEVDLELGEDATLRTAAL
jgi:hypothetical protein